MSGTTSQHHAVWENDGARVFYLPYSYRAPMATESLSYWSVDPGRLHAFFYNYWPISVGIALAYVIGIYSLRKWMRDKPAYSLKWQLLVWNSVLSAFSGLAAWRMSEEFRYVLAERGLRDSICLSVDPLGPAAFWAALFVLSKVGELVDTVFIVLRKRPLLFLHWYHHAVVLVYSWHSGRDMTAAGRWFILMNYSVHAVMYSYYFIVSAGWRLPKAVSMVVTSLQTAQMLVGIAISLCVAYVRVFEPHQVCQQSDDNLMLGFLIYLSFAFLFVRFFCNAYLWPRRRLANDLAKPDLRNGRLPQANGSHSLSNGGAKEDDKIRDHADERKKEI